VISLAQKQHEVIRIATLGSTKADSEETKRLATLTLVTITSDQKQTIDWLAKQKEKVSAKELALKKNTQTETDLTSAEPNGRFDEVFAQILLNELKDYQSSMQNTYSSLGSSGKALLEQNNKNVSLILKATES